MSRIQVFDLSGSLIDEVEVSSRLIVNEPHVQAIFDSVISERASQRQGTHSTLKKGEVSGGGRKPYKQKHTGRARQGSIRNPHYVGGGVAFGPKPNRNYNLKVNKKVSQLAFCSAFSYQLFKNVVKGLADDANPTSYSTKAFNNFVKKVSGKDHKVLVVLSADNEFLTKSARNLKNVILKK